MPGIAAGAGAAQRSAWSFGLQGNAEKRGI
jgi:hypothetical protein